MLSDYLSQHQRSTSTAQLVCASDFFDRLHRYFLDFQIKLVNINASDVVDGRPAVVLGLIWTIILYFQVGEIHTFWTNVQ